MTFYLLIILYGSPGPSYSVTRFDTKQECDASKKVVLETHAQMIKRVIDPNIECKPVTP